MKNILLILALMTAPAITAQTTESTDSIVNELQEIVVTANQPATKLIGTTLVSTISGSKLQNLGTCLDVLAQLPMLTVQDDNVQVTGKGSPEIYIDGRPMHDSDQLQQLLSTNINKIELLLAPGAMYSADTKAVLKITTKRNFIDGLSLTERAEVTARRKFSANNMLDLNYRNGKWDFFATGVIAHNNSLIKGITTNTLEYNGSKTIVGGSQYNTYPSDNGVIKGGLNFADGSQSFGAYYRYNPEKGNFKNTGTEWLNEEPRISRDITKEVRAHSHLVSVYYDNTFDEKYNLHFDGNFRSSNSRNNVLTSYPSNESLDVASHDRRKSTLWAGKLYIGFPLWGGNFVVGNNSSYTHTSLDYVMQNPAVEEYIPSSLTDARQTSVATFVSWEKTFGKLSLSAGLRHEYTDYCFKVNGERDNNVSRKDNLLTPDISLSWSFNETAQAALSYRLSTVKPPYSQLTGSLYYVGMHEIEGGNPTLRDEKMHDVQLFGMWKDFMLQTDFTRSIDTYAHVRRLYPANDLQLLLQPVNINVSALNIYLVWTKNIKAWMPNLTLGMYRQWLKLDNTKYNRPIFSYYFDNIISLPKDFQISLNAHGSTKGDMHTNRFGTTWFSMDASVSKSFLNKALQLKLSATDIFNTLNNDWTMNTYGVFVNKQQSYDRRGVSIAVTYRFHPVKTKYKGNNASEAEMQRL